MRILPWLALVVCPVSAPSSAEELARVAFATDAIRWSVTGRGGEGQLLPQGAILRRGDELVTTATLLQLDFPDGASVSLAPGSRMRLAGGVAAEGTSGHNMVLESGRLRLARGRNPAAERRVVAGAATVSLFHADALISVVRGLELSVGRGRAQVCVGGRCWQVAERQSARLAGGRIIVSPAPVISGRYHYGNEAAPYVGGEQRGGSGQILGVDAPRLTSGAGYTVAYTFLQGVGVGADGLASVTAEFDSSGAATAFSGGGSVIAARGVSVGGNDGVVAWGRWAAPMDVNQGGAPVSGVQSLVYVAGMPTPSLSALTGVQASFSLIGQTVPVSSTGMSGGSVTGTFDVTFGAPTVITATLRVPMAGAVFNLGGSTATNSALFNGQMFISCSPCGTGAGGGLGAFYGLFAGPAASRAAYSYIFESRSPAIGNIAGAVAFTR